MNIDHIVDRVRNREIRPIGVRREYSVLIPLYQGEKGLELIYELRAKNMNRQPGEISFPGGAVEPGESYEEAAIRETMEELKIARENIELLAPLDFLVSNSGIRINCFLGRIKDIDIEDIEPNPYEVDHIFTVPLDFLISEEPERYKVSFNRSLSHEFPYNLIPNGRDYHWDDRDDIIFFYNYGAYSIWGFTARMTKNFIDIIK